MSTSTRPTAAALIIGNEILSGKYPDENSPALIQEFRRIGVQLCRIETISDDIEIICEAVRRLASSHDCVVTSGGIGPTHDDLTIDGVAAALGTNVTIEQSMVAALEAHYGSELTPGQVRLARVPKGSVLHWLERGRWPAIQCKNVFIFPGVPSLFRRNLNIFRTIYSELPPFLVRSVTISAQESEVVTILDTIVSNHPRVSIGSYPRFETGRPELRLTLECDEPLLVDAALNELVTHLADELILKVD